MACKSLFSDVKFSAKKGILGSKQVCLVVYVKLLWFGVAVALFFGLPCTRSADLAGAPRQQGPPPQDGLLGSAPCQFLLANPKPVLLSLPTAARIEHKS